MENLVETGFQIHVLTSGKGLPYFQNISWIASLTPTDGFYYSGRNGGVSGWSTLKSIGSLAKIAHTKNKQLQALLDQIRPDIAVIDSEYSTAPFRSHGIPVIGLNSSEIVVGEYFKRRRIAAGTRSHFWFVEFADYLFHRHYCDLVLSPFL